MNATGKQHPIESEGPILVMASAGLIPTILVNALAEAFPGRVTLMEEASIGPFALARRRARHLGWPTAAGQLATAIVSRLTKRFTRRRIDAILAAYGHRSNRDPSVAVIAVSSINCEAARAEIARLRPAAVLTIACRLLSKETLAVIPCPVVNFHAGINPAYRGQMGAYWALAEGDPTNFGATLHLVDPGIDTGESLHEIRVEPDRADTMATYPLLLTAAGAKPTVEAIREALTGQLKPYRPAGPSHLRYPPTVWRWLWTGLRRGVW